MRLIRKSEPPLGRSSVDEARRRHAELYARCGAGPPVSGWEEKLLDCAGQRRFRVRILWPGNDPIGVIVYFHGGGWVLGSATDYDAFARTLAKCTRCVVVLADYRKAPQHPYPAAVEDAWTTLTWVSHELQALTGSSAKPILVAGDGAGGNLAAVATVRAANRGDPPIAMQILAYPILDADLERPSYRNADYQLLLTRETMIWFWDHYLPDVGLRHHLPEATPIHATALGGLPTTLLISAEFDPLIDEICDYATRLTAAGVDVTHRCFAGQMHGFLTLIKLLPTSEHVMRYIGWHVYEVLGR